MMPQLPPYKSKCSQVVCGILILQNVFSGNDKLLLKLSTETGSLVRTFNNHCLYCIS